MSGHPIHIETPYDIHWHDQERTILMCHPPRGWTWDDAEAIFRVLNAATASVTHGVYTIFDHTVHQSSMLPGGSAITRIKNLMHIQNENDELVFFVGASGMLRSILDLASRIYGLRTLMARVHYVAHLDEALEMIGAHKSKQKSA